MSYHEGMLLLILILEGMLRRFITTEILECGASLIFPERSWYDLVIVFLVNMAINPAVVFLDFLFRQSFQSVLFWMFFLETAVWLTESLIYKRCLRRKTNPFLFSFVLNGVSFGIGQLLQQI